MASAVFVAAAAELNRLALELTPVVLVVLLGYSYLKRVTQWSHLGLGLALGLAPTAAWIAVRGSLDPRILVLTGGGHALGRGLRRAVCLPGLRTRPRRRAAQPAAGSGTYRRVLGGARHASGHAGAAGVVRLAVRFSPGGLAGIAAVGLLLAYEHALVSPRDLRRLNAAFFTMNGVIAMVFLAFVTADLWLKR